MAVEPIHPTKACRKCGQEKGRSLEFYRSAKSNADGLSGTCRRCWLAQVAERRRYLKETKPDLLRERDRKSRLTADKVRKCERERSRRKQFPERYKEYGQRSYNNNREASLKYARERYKQTPPELRREMHRRWRESAPEKLAAMRERRQKKVRTDPTEKAKAAARMRRWRINNPMGAAAARDRRRAREFGAVGSYDRDDIKDILRVQGRFCFYCQCRLTKFECDHFIPLARGGSNAPDNIVLSCPSCNYSKGARMPWEWRPERFSEGQAPR